MSGYSELIKNFEKIRGFSRDLFIYGFKGRSDYTTISPRSYDNERRRIESYLSELIVKNRDKRGQTISISSNTTAKTTNPLFKVWQTKSFTKNDCFLHFVILDILAKHKSLGVTEITEIISSYYTTEAFADTPIDTMTIRNKLNEYVKLGILEAKKSGKSISYTLADNPLANLGDTSTQSLETALAYYKNLLPAGFIGHSISNLAASPFIYKQIFFSQILDDELTLQLLKAITEKKIITLTIISTKNYSESKTTVVPLKILSNTKTGRQYLSALSIRKRKFFTLRIDFIKDIAFGDECEEYDTIKAQQQLCLENSFSIVHQTRERLHILKMRLHIIEENEQYVIERIKREGKHGVISRVAQDTFEYSIEVADTLEMVPWLRTFIGRIISIEGSETHIITQFKRDLKALVSMYSDV